MNPNYGILLNQDAKMLRKRFEEMVRLLGITAIYKYPMKSKYYTDQGELKAAAYSQGEPVGCLFEEHENQKTARLLGWDAELLDKAAVIHVPYDLPHLQVGCLFEIPSAFDNTQRRLFRVTKMSAIMVYPSSVSCEIVPEYEDTMEQAEVELFTNTNFNVLNEE